jgi:outer membrane cobalamin receptor
VKFRTETFLAAMLLFPLMTSAQEPVVIGVMEFVAKGGVPQGKADALADVLADKIARMGEVRVITRSDILSMADMQERKRLTECTDEECVAEVGGALGVAWMVSGNVSRFGQAYLLNLKLYDVRYAEVPGRVSRQFKGGEERLLDELLAAATDLFEQVADRLELVPTVSVASRRIQLLAESPSAVTVFTRKEILSSGASDLPGLLRRVPGFDVYRIKPSSPAVGARALTDESNNLVLLLVDGREAMSEVVGFAFWNALTIDLEEVERVEVIRGPGSAMYGSNAFAAVISVTTLSERPRDGARALWSSGEEGNLRLFGRARDSTTLQEGTLDLSLSLGAEEKRSPSNNRDKLLDIYRAHGYVRYRKSRQLDLSLHAGAVGGEVVIYIHMGDLRCREALNYWVMGKSEIQVVEAARIKAQAYYSHYEGDFYARNKFRAYDMWIADIPVIVWDSHNVDLQVQFDWQPNDSLLFIGGGNLRYTTIDLQNANLSDNDESRGAGYLHVQWNPFRHFSLPGDCAWT